MKKIYLAIFTVLINVMSSIGQTSTEVDTSWKRGGFFGLNFSQVSLSQWAPGGENSLSIAGKFNVFSKYAKGGTEWSNFADLNYALLQTSSNGLRKSDDRIELQTKYSKKIKEKWDKWFYSGLANFKSQFANGYNYPDDSTVISKFLAPGFLTLALGVTYKPVEYFEIFLSPATGKWTFVTDKKLSDLGFYGVTPGKTVRSEFGAYLNLKFQKDVLTNVNLMSRLELFNNYTDQELNNRKNIDVNWETTINMKVNKWITASVTAQVVYDANVIERTQLRQVLGIGLGIKF